MKEIKNTEEFTTEIPAKYEKEAIINSKKWNSRRDLLGILLKKYILYSDEEIKKIIEAYDEGAKFVLADEASFYAPNPA